MKNTFKRILCFAITVVLLSAFSFSTLSELPIGSVIPKADCQMMDVSDKAISLRQAKQQNGLLVIFSCNTCPYVKLYETRIKEAIDTALKYNIGAVIINSNEAQRADEDSFEAMKKYAQEQELKGYYLVDKNSELADAFGATRTPHIFLFDKTKLVYRGAIDDNVRDPEGVKEHYLIDAIIALANGNEIKNSSTKSIGCSIKRLDE
jgi:thioredoxin-related protein